MTLIESQPAYLLHSRAFRDSSLLLQLLTRDHGIVHAIAKGVRRPGSRNKALLQAFIPLQVSLSGKRDLKTLRQVEALASAPLLQGTRLFSALYLNELLVRLLHGMAVEAGIFELYQQSLWQLAEQSELESVLRSFELALLDELGYGIDFLHCAESGTSLQPEQHYLFRAESGFLPVHGIADTQAQRQHYAGSELLLIAARDFSTPQARRSAKRILRQALAPLLGERPLKSRQLFLDVQG